MTELNTSYEDIDSILNHFEKPNPLEESRIRAFGYQSTLRAWVNEFGTDEVMPFFDQAIEELDADLEPLYGKIIVTGNSEIKSVDLKGLVRQENPVDFSVEYIIDPYGLDSEKVFLDNEPLQSLGYTIDVNDGLVVVSHLAKTAPATIISSAKYGDIAQTKRVYIPVDGTAFIEPEKDSSEVDVETLAGELPELLSDIDVAILNSEDMGEIFRNLSKINLKPYTVLNSNRELAQDLGKYINKCIGISRTTLFSVTGADTIRIQGENGEFIMGEIDPSLTMTGHIIGTGVDYSVDQFTMIAHMPFSNEQLRPVIYRINESMQIKEHPIFSI